MLNVPDFFIATDPGLCNFIAPGSRSLPASEIFAGENHHLDSAAITEAFC
jgi:hypothetical protein